MESRATWRWRSESTQQTVDSSSSLESNISNQLARVRLDSRRMAAIDSYATH
jgi:hypothetical protein